MDVGRSTIDLIRDTVDIEGRVERNPYLMVAGAFGVGFVLGGGLASRIVDRIAGAALRMGVMAAWSRLEHELGHRIGGSERLANGHDEKGASS
jgi:hypothetical protein